METLTLLLPVLWATVSTIIGIALYKSSSAFFESTNTSENQRRKIRLTGSVVIAALTFYGIKTATPSNRLETLPPNCVIVDRQTFNSISDLIGRVDRLSLELSGVIEVNDLLNAKSKAQQLREEVVALQNRLLTSGNKDKK